MKHIYSLWGFYDYYADESGMVYGKPTQKTSEMLGDEKVDQLQFPEEIVSMQVAYPHGFEMTGVSGKRYLVTEQFYSFEEIEA